MTYLSAAKRGYVSKTPLVCFNYHLVPNMAENKRNRKRAKRGPKRFFAWIDKFRALLVRYDFKAVNFPAKHHLAFALINPRHLMALKV
ncbi:MAG: hypothetical protein ACYDBJ_26755 [Aggregatilineales bacterium]